MYTTDLSIVVPCYNEASRGDFRQRIKSIIDYMYSTNIVYELVLVDDCSKDDTYKCMCEFSNIYNNVKTLHLDKNYGKSYALRQGFILADGKYTLMMDADLSIDLDNIKEFYDTITQDNYDVIVANRKNNKDNRGILRHIMSSLSGFCTRYILGIKIKDTQCGFKLFTTETLKKVVPYIKSSRWLIDIELLIYLQALNQRITSIEVITTNDLESTLENGEALKSSAKELFMILTTKKDTIRKITDNK